MGKKETPASPSLPRSTITITYGRDVTARANRFTLADLRDLVAAADAVGFSEASEVVLMPKTSVLEKSYIYIKAPEYDATP